MAGTFLCIGLSFVFVEHPYKKKIKIGIAICVEE